MERENASSLEGAGRVSLLSYRGYMQSKDTISFEREKGRGGGGGGGQGYRSKKVNN